MIQRCARVFDPSGGPVGSIYEILVRLKDIGNIHIFIDYTGKLTFIQLN